LEKLRAICAAGNSDYVLSISGVGSADYIVTVSGARACFTTRDNSSSRRMELD
jgi:hypothetical protein